MTRSVWRIATDTPEYEADDTTGAGAKKTGGRWNEAGVAMIYTSESRALACLETIVHLNAGALPLNRYLVHVAVREEDWTDMTTLDPSLLVGWDAEPAGRASIRYGSDWARSGTSLLLRVPSVVVPEEYNLLINPEHPAAQTLVAIKLRRWTYDPRLRPARTSS